MRRLDAGGNIPENSLPGAGYQPRIISENYDCSDGIITFSMNPEQGARCQPIGKGVPFDAPRCSTLVVRVRRSVEIRRIIGGIVPSSKVLARLVPYTRSQAIG